MAETQEKTSGEISIVTKLTLKGLGCEPSQCKVEKREVALARIYGRGMQLKYKDNSTFGTMDCRIVGSFEGVNLQSGEIQRSAVLYLPKGISEMVEQAVARVTAEGGAGVEFAFELRSKPASNPIGYTYSMVPLLKPKESDELEALRSQFASDVKKQLTDGKSKK